MLYQPPYKWGAVPAVPGIYNDNANASYINGDPEIGREGSYFPAEAIEWPQRELVKLLSSSGITPSKDLLDQVAEGAARYASRGVFGIDSGAKNAHVVNVATDVVAPRGFFKGMRAIFYAIATNDAATTLNAWGLGIKPVYDHTGTALSGGEILTNRLTDMFYDPALNAGSGAWKLAPWANALLLGTNTVTINNYASTLPYIADTSGAANTVTAPFSPALSSYPAGAVVLVKIANTNTGATNVTINALTARPIVMMDGTAVPPGALKAGMVAILLSDGTNAQLANPARTSRGLFAASAGGITIPNAGTVTITDWTASKNDFGAGALSSGVFTVPSGMDGWYEVTAQVYASPASGNAQFGVALHKNGLWMRSGVDCTGNDEGADTASVAAVLYLAAGDTITIKGHHHGGFLSSMTVDGSSSYLSLAMIG